MQQKKIILLAADCESSRWVYNALKSNFNLSAVIIEQPVPKKTLIRGRLKKIGLIKVTGQIMFSLLAVPFLKMKSKKRKAELLKLYNLSSEPFDPDKSFLVNSVNEDACLQLLQQLQPDIILVNGTRIISKKILQSTNAFFINMHVGITPKYRGSHGGYWAMHNNDVENFGTTIHLIDTGVDTGAVIKQVFAKPGRQDNFITYPILQTAIGIAALQEVLPGIINGEYQAVSNTVKGKMYYQPAIWQYLFG